ncbi:protein msta isoform X2 [Eurytemora carolleeae]|uniref:protein msta isoform X2 n=1 Tax=Eurytemora carolleeae TaxID=1294199 RepID=UPI000C78D8FE|nr:protein msta isoform X2 [Eurytemora carolleeae]|eukprot:XP_023333178.1 protein msta-like isoform X2 [Eurytemora affinis]
MSKESDSNRCFLCFKSSTLECSECRLVYACSTKHLKEHRNGDFCSPFRVEFRDDVGRYLVSTRNIKKKELILTEPPFVTGPSLGRGLVCAECLKSIKISVPCFSCNIPLCNQSCGDKANHRLECQYFQNPLLQGALGESDNAQTVLDIILPLRYLLKSEYLQQTVTDLSKGEPWPEPETSGLKQVLCLEEHRELLQDCMRIVFTNSKSLVDIGLTGSAVYNVYSLMNHSCVPNTNLSIAKDLSIRVVSNTDIGAGTEISTRYGGLNIGQPRRSELLYQHWRFRCKCSRCEDPTELETRTSGILCQVQDCSGYILPYTSLLWRCETCQGISGLDYVLRVIRKAESNIKNNLGGEPDSGILEKTISVLETSLHPNHYLISQVKFVLVSWYAQAGRELSREEQERIVQVSLQLIDLLQRLDPVNVTLGRVLRILIPVWSQANKQVNKQDFESGIIEKKEFERNKLKCFEFVDLLIASSSINKAKPN